MCDHKVCPSVAQTAEGKFDTSDPHQLLPVKDHKTVLFRSQSIVIDKVNGVTYITKVNVQYIAKVKYYKIIQSIFVQFRQILNTSVCKN